MTRNTFRRQVALLAVVYVLISSSVGAQTDARLGTVLGRIIFIEPKASKGALRVQQSRRVNSMNATEGMLVRKGYLLTLRANARAAVVCGDGKMRELAPGPQGCPCTRPCSPEVCGINYDGSTIGATRGPDTDKSTFPVLISPRKTMLRTPRPAIRWAPVAGPQKNYQVTMYGEGGKLIWRRDVASGTRLNFPDEEPPLQPGQTYKVVVTSDGLSSEQDSSPGLGFTTMATEQARALEEAELEIGKLALPANQTRFLVANLYAAKKLYAEAIDLLESLSREMKAPSAARMHGDLYAVIGLSREAEKRYLLAFSLADVNDFDERARTQRNLASVYETLGNLDQAIARLREATIAYRRLGYRTLVAGLLKEERRLKRQRNR